MAKVIYLDTSVLIEPIIGTDQATKSIVNESLHKMARHGGLIIIPQLVMGEACTKIYERSLESKSDPKSDTYRFIELLGKLNFNVKECIPPTTDRILQLALAIQRNDNRIDYCDCVIVSHALSDDKATHLYTMDKYVMRSTYIKKQLDDYKNENGHELRISDTI